MNFADMSLEELLVLETQYQSIADNKNIDQHALKILINALYGALANKFFLLANPDLAAAITSSGRFFIQLLANNVEDELQKLMPSKEPYVISGDTDSIYYSIKPFVHKKFGKDANRFMEGIIDWCDEFEKTIIQRVIKKTTDEYADILNIDDPSQIGVEREIIADAAIFVAKKKYFARVIDAEGVRYPLDKPKIKIMGLEIARSSTPEWVRTKLKESIDVILDTNEQGLKKWRDVVKADFQNQPIRDISMTAGISRLDYDINEKGIPQGPKSALVHNIWVEKNNLQDQIELLAPGEKYKRCYLKQPNQFNSEIISYFDDKIADIIKEDNIYDYSLNFEKYFENPLENMAKSLGYNINSQYSLEDW